jgi:hypothetical protein
LGTLQRGPCRASGQGSATPGFRGQPNSRVPQASRVLVLVVLLDQAQARLTFVGVVRGARVWHTLRTGKEHASNGTNRDRCRDHRTTEVSPRSFRPIRDLPALAECRWARETESGLRVPGSLRMGNSHEARRADRGLCGHRPNRSQSFERLWANVSQRTWSWGPWRRA